MKRWGFVPKRIITDKLRSYGAAKREVAPGLDHWSHKGLNNRAENSHLPLRKRERGMQGFRSPRSIRGVELRGKCRLINDQHANLQTQTVNVTTPNRAIDLCNTAHGL